MKDSCRMTKCSYITCVVTPTAGRGTEYCDGRSVCLSVREHISGSLTEFFGACYSCGHGSVLLWRRCDMLRYVTYFQFMNDIFARRHVDTVAVNDAIASSYHIIYHIISYHIMIFKYEFVANLPYHIIYQKFIVRPLLRGPRP